MFTQKTSLSHFTPLPTTSKLTIILLIACTLTSQALAQIKLPVRKHQSTTDTEERLLQSNSSNYSPYLKTLNTGNSVYTINITIGTSNIPYTLALDTNSSFITLTDPALSPALTTNTYSCDDSPSCNATNKVSYSSNSTSFGQNTLGYIVTDNVNLLPNLTASNVPIFVVNGATSLLTVEGVQIDGFFGIQQNISITGNQVLNMSTILDVLLNSSLINVNVYSLFLSHDTNSTDTASELIFGGFNPSVMAGNYIMYVNVTYPWNWGLKLSTIYVSNETVKPDSGASVTFSTTINSLLFRNDDYQKVWNTMHLHYPNCSNTTYSCVCNTSTTLNQLPYLTFIVGPTVSGPSYELILQANQYFVYNAAEGVCTALISSYPCIHTPCPVTLGVPFMSAYYTVFKPGQGNATATSTGSSIVNGAVGFIQVNPTQTIF